MKITQIPNHNASTFQMNVTCGSLSKQGPQEVEHLSSGVRYASYRISRDTTLKPVDDQVATQLHQWLVMNPHYLASAVGDRQRAVAELHLHPIAQSHELDEMEFAVNDDTLQKSKALNSRISHIDSLLIWLDDQCILEPSPGSPDLERLLVSTGKELDPDLPSSYTLHGRSIRVSVVPHELPDGSRIMRVERITRARSQFDPDLPIRLLRGRFAFKDDSSVARVRREADLVLERAFEGKEMRRYLSSWDHYGQSQITLSFEEVLEIGALTYDSCRPLEGTKVSFVLDSDQPGRRTRAQKLARSRRQEVAISHEPPSWIGMDRVDLAKVEDDSSLMSESTLTSGRYIGMTQDEVILEVKDPDALPKRGCLYISFRGDLAVMSRRYNAQKAIRASSTPLPYLGVLLEGLEFPLKVLPVRHSPMSARVKDKVFPQHPPTDSQRQAIKCALDTPDIAIIQGPPGTGKTTVIEAIVERLNELYQPEDTRAGQVIITSYQHDAVENALQRITVNGLPSPKIGQRSSGGERIDDTKHSQMEREEFSRSILETLRHQSEHDGVAGKLDPPLYKNHDRLRALIEDFHRTHATFESALRTVNEVRSLLSPHCSSDAACHSLREVSSHLSRCGLQQSERMQLLRKVWALRTCQTSHADDGPQRADDLLDALESWGGTVLEHEIELLDHAIVHPRLEQEHLDALARLRRRLMINLHETYIHDVTLPGPLRTRVASVLAQAAEALQEQIRLKMSPTQRLQLDFLQALDSEHDRFVDTLRHYTIVHGATCQQIAGRYFHDAHHGELVHDAVVVDEAARANPLDLFIPMARGKKIILVGDHRQLPHIVEENILETMLSDDDDEAIRGREDVEGVIREHLETSLFYKLFESLKAQEKRDGITRTITLNAQFRMHPTLGDFVGKHFYEPHREPYTSPLSAEHFTHGLDRHEGRCAAWIDVPLSYGKEISGQSKSRPVEARQVAEELARLLADDPEETLSFGVITFYRAQVDQINEACRRLDIEERLQQRGVLIGTVDAFQGKEFDVVLLSMVRSRELPLHKSLDEKGRRRTFGHLMNSNRMCVAFSRQKKLLIVVGDSRMLEHSAAKEALAPLVDFHKLATHGSHDEPS